MAQFALHTAIKLMYVNGLRQFFESHELAQQFRWSSDPAKRQIDIVAQWPQEPQTFPLLVVDVAYASEGERYLSDAADVLKDGSRTEGQMFSGVDNFDVRMTVSTHAKPDCDQVSDLLIFGLKRVVEMAVWEASNMTVIPQRNARAAGGGARPFTDGQLVYFTTISQPAKAHWFDEIIYNPRILTYLATAEIEGLDAAASTFQTKAGT